MTVTYRTGHGVPSNSLGSNGDYYLDIDTQDVYLRSAGTYAVAYNTGEQTLNANALTTVAHAKAWLRRNNATGTPSTDDTTLLTMLINSVSAAIIKATGRQFLAETAATKTFQYTGDGFVNLYPYELSSITSVTMGGTTMTAATGVGDGDYFAMPRNKTPEGTYLYLTMRSYLKPYPSSSLFAPTLNERDVVIVGDWGMSSVPADVEMACLIAVADLYRNPEQGQTRGTGEFEMVEVADNPGSEESLPPGAMRLLEPYIRPVVG